MRICTRSVIQGINNADKECDNDDPGPGGGDPGVPRIFASPPPYHPRLHQGGRAPRVRPLWLFVVEGPAAFSSSSSSSSSSIDERRPTRASSAGVAALAMLPDNAFAKGGEYGIFEGRISSLAHPAIMGVCFFVSLGAAYTGFQWRRIRDIMTEIGDMKTELAPKKGMMDRYKAMEEPSAADTAALAKVEAEVAEMNKAIDEKTNLRKDLLALDFRNRHWALGSVLLGLGISFAIEGPVNTYMRAGKLFPGPHLYAGAGCVAMWPRGRARGAEGPGLGAQRASLSTPSPRALRWRSPGPASPPRSSP